MTQKESSQLKMFNLLKANFYIRHKEFCDNIPAIKIIFKQLNSRWDKLDRIRGKGGRGREYRELKILFRQNLCKTASIISSGLFAFANLTKNKALRGSVNYCYSDFFRSEEVQMLNRCKQILRTAHRTKGLAFVGFDENLLVELQDNIQKYEKIMQEKDESKKETMQFNFLISKLVRECMQLLEHKLNPIMKMLSKKYPLICMNYFLSIPVNKQAGRKKKRNKHQKPKRVKSNILQQKYREEILHHFGDLVMAE